ncbi:uncharacterized protein METZ01_LOCUS209181 [marine metagenome]|uniref:Tetratricopeptide repeat protein n=1 Tax=marine metagenome TaxID=408172 RepID=A0A382F2M8_9ZZZZ
MINVLDKKTLENRFAEDFGSPLFPLLAEIYLSEGDIIRAKKVCEVGLEHNSNNTDGKFIFARISIGEEKYTQAEKWLKQVVNENPAHFKGLRMLINLEIKLKRSHKTIQNYINRLLQFLPHDSDCIKWIDRLHSPIENAVSLKEKVEGFSIESVKLGASENINHFELIKAKTYSVDKSMATFTMVQVLKLQKHYNQAIAVLDVLESQGFNKDKINHEKDTILKLMSSS